MLFKFKTQWLCPTTLIRSYLLPKSYIRGEELKMLPHTRPVTHSKKEKKKFPLQDPENATIYKTDAFQKNILKLKFKKKLTNIYIYDKT